MRIRIFSSGVIFGRPSRRSAGSSGSCTGSAPRTPATPQTPTTSALPYAYPHLPAIYQPPIPPNTESYLPPAPTPPPPPPPSPLPHPPPPQPPAPHPISLYPFHLPRSVRRQLSMVNCQLPED